MNIQNLQINNNQRMSSREIAELTNKEHKNVKRDCLVMFDELEIDALIFERIFIDNMNRQQTEYLLNKDLTITLVSGYNAKIRYLIIQRWQELEAQASAPVIPATLSEALRLAADQAELIEDQQSRLALAEPKAAALDVIDSAMGSLNARDTAKTLGVQPQKFNAWCIAHNWMYRDNKDKLQMCSNRLQQGFMSQRPVTYTVPVNRNGVTVYETRATTQPLFTPKGLTHLARLFAIVHEVA
ncbi:phage regulatory protein/antirepressor Ant [Psychrobacter cibarius]|nr:phage regulatory protein/antirepressor Ant [Psychrobacter cibarius]